MKPLKNKFCLVTGSSGGIGYAIARSFLERGASVGLHYCYNHSGATALAEIYGDRCRVFQANFSDTLEILRLWDEFIDWSGEIAVLVNNAGVATAPESLVDLPEDVWDGAFQVNTKAPLLLSQRAMKLMKASAWGRIINISSIGVKFGGGVTTAHYSASKAALEAITRSFAKEGASRNVLVNAIRVGVTETDFHEKMGRYDLATRAKVIPLQRIAQPQEVANMVLFLASEESSFVTGSTIPVSGGE